MTYQTPSFPARTILAWGVVRRMLLHWFRPGYIRASKVAKDAPPFASQDFLMRLAEGKVALAAIPALQRKTAPAKTPRKRVAADR